jgi:hypothetical protein
MTAALLEPTAEPAGAGATCDELACPSCHQPFGRPVRVSVETSRQATRRPISPELIHICPHCHALLILALHPALSEGCGS